MYTHVNYFNELRNSTQKNIQKFKIYFKSTSYRSMNRGSSTLTAPKKKNYNIFPVFHTRFSSAHNYEIVICTFDTQNTPLYIFIYAT